MFLHFLPLTWYLDTYPILFLSFLFLICSFHSNWEIILCICLFLFFIFWCRDWTQDLLHAKNALYHWATPLACVCLLLAVVSSPYWNIISMSVQDHIYPFLIRSLWYPQYLAWYLLGA
jgi:hypothetical protein